jgi:prepilin-type N-terminal cleavage/methylation domain-containing protein/prepilin-type processing-associated H-X9-DG protein
MPCAHIVRINRAFTLIELLVVIAIVAMIIGIMLPALGAARDAGRAVHCLSNQRQLGLALVMYAEEFDEWHPREAWDGFDVSWPRAFRPLVDPRASWEYDLEDQFETAEYYRDPARDDDGHNIHYVNNGLQFRSPGVYGGLKPETRMSAYLHPSLTLYLTCYAQDPTGRYVLDVYRNGTTNDNWVARWYDIWSLSHIAGSQIDLRIDPKRHANGANGLYLDGHAAHVQGRDLRNIETWDDHDYRRRSH